MSANYTQRNHAEGVTSNACKWDPIHLKNQINFYFQTTEGQEYPTKVGLLTFLELPDRTYESWKENSNSRYCKSLLKEIVVADRLIKKHHLKMLLANPENSKWYLERAYRQDYHVSKIERLEIDSLNKTPDTNIKIVLDNKGKNTIE